MHGDGRSDNFMFSPDGEAIILDWAMVSRGHPGFDVGYLLSSCLDADRITSLGPLVEHYHGTLTGLGVDFDPAELRRGVGAAYEINAVLQLLTLTVFEGQGDNTGSEMAICGCLALRPGSPTPGSPIRPQVILGMPWCGGTSSRPMASARRCRRSTVSRRSLVMM